MRLLGLFIMLMAPVAGLPADRAAVSYRRYCRNCHDPEHAGQTPNLAMLRRLTAEKVLDALEKGPMKPMAERLTKQQRRALAEYVSGKKLKGDSSRPKSDRKRRGEHDAR